MDGEPAMSAGDDKGNGFREHRAKIGNNPVGSPTRPDDGASTPKQDARARRRRGARARVEPLFRTEVAVCDVTVTGVLAGTARLPVDTIAISGDVRQLSRDEALELVDALLLVVTRLDDFVEERDSAAPSMPLQRPGAAAGGG
jgi:hypothetical protein